ncbi:AAA family ATPase [Streptomyces boninensis]|uniref:AAA family ATPase n=1 Tax=Streptomyces boninensis TaxID=2039455 RepID=UPI003B211DD6
MRIAFVGAYGNGKTTLTTELSKRLGLERTHGSAMRDPAGGSPKALEETNEPELIQLAVRRYTERVSEETPLQQDGFLSDGSVLHEWVYTKVRLAVGRHPEPSADLDKAPRTKQTEIYEEVVGQLALLAREQARTGYDLFIHCPVEFPLPEGHSPISEPFRTLSDELMLKVVRTLDIPLHIVSGTVEERIEQILKLPGVPQGS